MNEPKEIPAAMLSAAVLAVHSLGYLTEGASEKAAEVAIEAAGVPALIERIADYEENYRRVINSQCAADERHCACVPELRTRIAELEASLTAIRRHTNPDGEDGTYRFDSANDACDFAFAEAEQAMKSAGGASE